VTVLVQAVPFGQVLDVIPWVSADGYTIQMNIVPTFTEFLGYDIEAARQFRTVVPNLPVQDTPLPRFRARQVATTAIVWDGQTVVLGGLIAENVRKTREKVPVLGDIPFVGRLFRSEAADSTKKNLVIFVTPTIIDPAGNRVHSPDNLPYDPNRIPEQRITNP
jgi:type II secretory pathway component GspD/PulD (secretin)